MAMSHSQEMAPQMMIAVFGRDCPGIVARISGTLAGMGCNIEDATQTILHGRFAGMFVITPSPRIPLEQVLAALENAFADQELSFWGSSLEDEAPASVPEPGTPFVITTIGPDQLGLVAGVTQVLAEFGVNIAALRANVKTEDASQWVMIYEVDAPAELDGKLFRKALYAKAEELGQELSVQHRRIFEAVHRV